MTFARVIPGGASVGSKLTSAVFNQLDIDHSVSASDAQLAVVSKMLLQTSAQNWQAPFTWSTGVGGPYCVTWCDLSPLRLVSQVWIAGGFAAGGSPSLSVWYGTGNDSTFTTLCTAVGSLQPPRSIVVDNANNVWVSVTSDPNTAKTIKGSLFGGALATNTTTTFTGLTDFVLTTVGSTCIGAVSAPAGAGSLVQVSAGALTVGLAGFSAPGFILKSNQSYAVAVPVITGSSAYKSANGVTWTSAALSAVGGSEVPIDLAWNPVLSTWLLATNSGSQTSFYTSSDGATFTFSTMIVGFLMTSLTCSANGVWAGTIFLPGNAGRVVYSVDGVNWYESPSVVTGIAGNLPTVAASPVGFFACMAPDARQPSVQIGLFGSMRFSYQSGNPTKIT